MGRGSTSNPRATVKNVEVSHNQPHNIIIPFFLNVVKGLYYMCASFR